MAPLYDDPIGCKAAAIMSKRVFDHFRPGGAMKVHGGALVLVHGLTEQDFKEMHDAGVWLIAEIGGGGLSDPAEVEPMSGVGQEIQLFLFRPSGAALHPWIFLGNL